MIDVDRFKSALVSIVREIVAEMIGLPGVYEYRVSRAEDGKLTARVASKGIGLPDVVEIPIRGSIVGGTESKLKGGVSVLVGFVNSDRARPFLAFASDTDAPEEIALEASTSAAIKAPQVILAEGVLGVARQTDPILAAGIFAGTITAGSTKVKAG
jgi:hypothetical protein